MTRCGVISTLAVKTYTYCIKNYNVQNQITEASLQKKVYFCTMIQVEICCNSVASATNAKQGGARRIELCANLEVGGTTPSYDDILYCTKQLGLRTHVLIRPREGNFVYSDDEFQTICRDVEKCKELGAAAVVVGFLTEQGCVDAERTKHVVSLAAPMEVTFHRAFDELTDFREGLDTLLACGCHRVLTSGCHPTVMEGKQVLKELVEQAQGRIVILAGGGVTPQNASALVEYTHVGEIHGSCKTTLPDGSIVTDAQIVNQLIQITHTL